MFQCRRRRQSDLSVGREFKILDSPPSKSALKSATVRRICSLYCGGNSKCSGMVSSFCKHLVQSGDLGTAVRGGEDGGRPAK